MGGTCGTYERQEKCIQGFGEEKGRVYVEDLGVDRGIILKLIYKWVKEA
jgi:hypothetical protein